MQTVANEVLATATIAEGGLMPGLSSVEFQRTYDEPQTAQAIASLMKLKEVSVDSLTGAGGGVFRDIFINVEPLVFRKDIYATACLAGGMAYWGVGAVGGSDIAAQALCAVTIIVLRMCALKWDWSLPVLTYDPETADDFHHDSHPRHHHDDHHSAR